jgi:hypothetical protein
VRTRGALGGKKQVTEAEVVLESVENRTTRPGNTATSSEMTAAVSTRRSEKGSRSMQSG